jgi:hypothetical protein
MRNGTRGERRSTRGWRVEVPELSEPNIQ